MPKSRKYDKVPDASKIPEDLRDITLPRYPRSTGGLLPCVRSGTGGLATCYDDGYPIPPSKIRDPFMPEDKDFEEELRRKIRKKKESISIPIEAFLGKKKKPQV